MRVSGAIVAGVLAVSATACGPGGSHAGSLPPNPDESILHPGTVASPVRAWQNNGGGKALLTVDGDNKKMLDEIVRSDITALINDCRTFTTDVVSAQALPAIPDAAADRAWQAGLKEYGGASRLCYGGAINKNPATLNEASAWSTRGSQLLIAAVKRIGRLIRSGR